MCDIWGLSSVIDLQFYAPAIGIEVRLFIVTFQTLGFSTYNLTYLMITLWLLMLADKNCII